jgi:hypothetical protein
MITFDVDIEEKAKKLWNHIDYKALRYVFKIFVNKFCGNERLDNIWQLKIGFFNWR